MAISPTGTIYYDVSNGGTITGLYKLDSAGQATTVSAFRGALHATSPDMQPTPGILTQTPAQKANREERFNERLLYLTRRGRF